MEYRAQSGDRVVSSMRVNHLRDQLMRDQRQSNRQDAYENTTVWLTQGNLQFDKKLPAQNVLTLGGDGIFELARNPRIVRYEDCDFEMPTRRCQTAQRGRGAVYGQNVFTPSLSPYAVIVSGARVEVDSQFGAEFVPRLAVRFDPIEPVVLRVSVGRGYRAPSFKELYLRFDNPSVGYTVRGNTTLEPERSTSYQTSLDWKVIPRVRFHLSGFRNDINGLIDFRSIDSDAEGDQLDRFELTNIATAYTQGVVTELTYGQWPLFELRAAFQRLDARNLIANRPLSGRAKNQISGTMNLREPSGRFSFNAVSVWTDRRPFYLAEDDGGDEPVYAKEYHNLSLNLCWYLHRALRLSLRGENLLNEGEERFLAQRPRR